MGESRIDELAVLVEGVSPQLGLARLCEVFGDAVKFSTSLGKEDQALTHLIARHNIPVNIFTLDTGRLFPETYDLWHRTEKKYNIKIKAYFPDQEAVEELISENGINGFYDSVEKRKRCCYIRKVEGLQRALEGARVWVTGLRAEQSENRSSLSVLEWDENFQVIKYNPLMDWTDEHLEDFIKQESIPVNTLHNKGYLSIGCAPCTKPVRPGAHARSGRWWWEDSKKECGLHAVQEENKE